MLESTSLTRSQGVRISRLSIPSEGLGIRGECTGCSILGRGTGSGEGDVSILSGGRVGQGYGLGKISFSSSTGHSISTLIALRG